MNMLFTTDQATLYVDADIIRKKFNYGYSHEINLPINEHALAAVVEQYGLGDMPFRVGENAIYFQRSLTYTVMITGDEIARKQLVRYIKDEADAEADHDMVTKVRYDA